MAVSPWGVQTVVTRIRFCVSVPVLSVQITEVDPSVSTADSRLTRAPRWAISRTPTASASVIVGSSPSGTLATSSPIAKLAADATLSPAARPIGRNAIPAPTATNAISQVARLTWRSSGLSSGPARWLSAAIRPSSVRIPVAVTSASASPPVQAVPLNTTSLACSSGTEVSAGRRAGYRHRLAGQRGHVDLDRAGHQARVRADAFPFLDQQDIAGYQQPGLDLLPLPVALDPGALGQERGQRLDGPFGLHLLRERETGVQEDHRDDRDPQPRCPADPRQHGGHGQQHRQRLGELPGEFTGPAQAAVPGQLVRAGDFQPAGRLTAWQASR